MIEQQRRGGKNILQVVACDVSDRRDKARKFTEYKRYDEILVLIRLYQTDDGILLILMITQHARFSASLQKKYRYVFLQPALCSTFSSSLEPQRAVASQG